MIKEAIVKIVNKEDLTYDEAYTVMNEIMSGETTPTQNAAFLAALSTKSARAETTDEIAGCAAAMRAHATKVETGMELFEIVGTGGDNAHSFNISTTSALVAAAGGMKVAKHGNRAASSQCGTADCLEALGVNIQQSPAKCIELLNDAGMCFFFAQKYHTSMKYVGAIRKELGFRTVFNILGPLTNPGTPSMQLLGVYDDYLVEPLAQVLISLGIKRGMVVYGQDKLDEISMAGLLHDIGKFKIPDEILLKPGKLTKEEFEVIKKHTVYGYEILNNFKILESTKRAALLHHEKFDGSGYPFGYTADKIDDISAIITIADVYDAMTSKRCYRDGMCPFDVIADFEYDGISKYHPKYIGMFLKKIASSYIGSTVLLTNGKKAKIIFVTEKYSRPTVTLLEDNSVLVLKDEKDIKIAAVL